MMKQIACLIFFLLICFAGDAQEPLKNFSYTNPVIRGMNPDPSVCRVGEDYYAVTSSFLRFPGVPIYHSKDLIHWEMIGYCLSTKSQLNLEKGSGIYAPTLRYHNGTFYMITTNRRNGENFFVTATNPAGPWSQPIWLTQEGIDPSLFFDDDGKVYFTSTGGGGILQREIDIKTGNFLTPPVVVWAGTGARYPEGPHLYKINNVYYLLISEGGTEYGHQVVIGRCNNPWGPFESNPNNPILTHRNGNAQSNVIQGVGHADLVQAHDGSWWAVLLAFRQQGSHHHIGREMYLAPVTWLANGWPVVNTNGTVDIKMNVATLPQHSYPIFNTKLNFDDSKLPLEWNFIRNPDSSAFSLSERKGWLRLKGSRNTLDSNGLISFVGKRQTDLYFSATALLNFNPADDSEEAGLSVYHRDNGHYDVFIQSEGNSRFVMLRFRVGSIVHIQNKVKVSTGDISLRVEGTPTQYRFSFLQNGKAYNELGTVDTKLISSETLGGFVGAFVGLYATGNGKTATANADFDWFEYLGKDK